MLGLRITLPFRLLCPVKFAMPPLLLGRQNSLYCGGLSGTRLLSYTANGGNDIIDSRDVNLTSQP